MKGVNLFEQGVCEYINIVFSLIMWYIVFWVNMSVYSDNRVMSRIMCDYILAVILSDIPICNLTGRGEMNMTLRQIRFFLAVCEDHSLSKAARRLYMKPPALSRAIVNSSRNSGLSYSCARMLECN
jgi:hypothetical protein